MAWIIHCEMEGLLCLSDIGATLRKGQQWDLDVIGRENAERSSDVKVALNKGWIREVRKDDAPAVSGTIDPELVSKIETATKESSEAARVQTDAIKELKDQTAEQAKTISDLKDINSRLESKLQEQDDKQDEILSKLKAFAESFPLEVRHLKETLQNIKVERSHIAEERESMVSSEQSDEELAARERILNIRDKKLEKNAKEIGNKLSKEIDDVDDALDALDNLGI